MLLKKWTYFHLLKSSILCCMCVCVCVIFYTSSPSHDSTLTWWRQSRTCCSRSLHSFQPWLPCLYTWYTEVLSQRERREQWNIWETFFLLVSPYKNVFHQFLLEQPSWCHYSLYLSAGTTRDRLDFTLSYILISGFRFYKVREVASINDKHCSALQAEQDWIL